jgi:hypothetical protein
VEREVPYRDHATTRSATHADLVQMLVPLLRLPAIELTFGSLTIQHRGQGRDVVACWRAQLTFYIVPRGDERLVIPDHGCKLDMALGELWRADPIQEPYIALSPLNPTSPRRGQLIEGTDNELIVNGPGLASLVGTLLTWGRVGG